MSKSPVGSDRKRFLSLINDAHDRSGRSLREVGEFCGVDHAYISRILNGERLANRDIILALCLFGWNLDGYDIEDILKSGGYKTILNWKKCSGRTSQRNSTSDHVIQRTEHINP